MPVQIMGAAQAGEDSDKTATVAGDTNDADNADDADDEEIAEINMVYHDDQRRFPAVYRMWRLQLMRLRRRRLILM